MAATRGLLLLLCCSLMWCQPSRAASRLPKVLQDLDSNQIQPEAIRAELIHRNHPDSPLRAIPRDRRRARRLEAGVEFTTPVSSALPYGDLYDYVMTLYLGTPAQRFVVLVDTGSDLVWVQCQPCIWCYNQTNPIFDPAASASYSALNCSSSSCNSEQAVGARCNRRLRTCLISAGYATPDSAILGQLATETLAFSNDTASRLAVSSFLFGCMDNTSPAFGIVDGIAGLGRGPLSLPSQLAPLTPLPVFSYCLVPLSLASNSTSSLLFGAANPGNLPLLYTPILDSSSSFYWINLTSITINGTAVNISLASLQRNFTTLSGGTVFDSGTDYTILTTDVFTPLVQKLREMIDYPTVVVANETLCYNVTGATAPVFPTVSLELGGVGGDVVEFVLGAENVFLPPTSDLAVQCLGMLPSSNAFNIIGNIAQADHYVETDLANMRIGWASRNCSLPL